MMMLIDCTGCRTPLQLPPGADSVRCVVCGAVTHVANGRQAPPQPPAPYYGGYAPQPPGPYYSGYAPPPSAPPPSAPPQQPATYNGYVPWAPPPPNAHGRKKAVICGITYRNTGHELSGCVNDAKCMRYLLVNRFGFSDSSIVMLTEEATDPYRIPTKHNIRMALYWLVQGCQPGDSLVFHYSGHGSQQRDYVGDEVDGFDETLVPLDYQTQGVIVDNEINATIVRPLPHGVKLHAIMDCCHSGTMLDLPYLCKVDSNTGYFGWVDERPPNGTWKGTSGGEAIAFSGCDDDQTSADTSALSQVTSTGAMTFCFIQAIERGYGTTYGSILNSMRSTIRNTEGLNGSGLGGGVVTTLISMLLTGGSYTGGTQDPQLTSNEMFDIYHKPFSL